MFFGFSPALGLRTILGICFAFALNLNRVAVLLGVYSNLPWLFVPYYTLTTWMGAGILGIDVPPGVVEGFVTALEDRSWADFRAAAGALKPFLWAFALGSTLGASALAMAAHRVAFVTITAHRKRQHGSHDTQA